MLDSTSGGETLKQERQNKSGERANSSMAQSMMSQEDGENNKGSKPRDDMKWRSNGISHQDIRDDLSIDNIIKIKRLQTKMVYLRDEKYINE